jgi:hypothetical protein
LGFLESGYYVAVIKVKNAEDADLTETISLGNYFIQHLFDKTQGACKVGLIAGLVCVRAGHGDGAGRAWCGVR